MDYFICSDNLFPEGSRRDEKVDDEGAESQSQSQSQSSCAEISNSKKCCVPTTVSAFDCYILQKDTVGCSDHCPVVLILKL